MSALERLLAFSQSCFNSERFADKRCEVCAIKDCKCEFYVSTESFTEFLLLVGVSADVIFSVAGQFEKFPLIFIHSHCALCEFAELPFLLVHQTLRNVPCTKS